MIGAELFQLQPGHEPAVPLLLDSPHSGSVYPDDFRYVCPLSWLRQTEDAFVDALFADAPAMGITLLKALFARSYIDVNRAETDIDPRMVEGDLPLPLTPTERSLSGHGLIRNLCRGQPVYAGKIGAQEVISRIQRCYRPYHAALEKNLNDLRARFGAVWHLDCHSMPSVFPMGALGPMPIQADFILGDRDGTSCEKAFTAIIAQTLRAMGYRVVHNDPYKGVEIIARYGQPLKGVHSLQLEISRALYMDEKTLQPHEGFEKLRRNLNALLQELRGWIAMRMEAGQKLAAE
ncbi:MAG TPA: N-formylglutamate amidohydrolase [Alphaproteobacteria bacterium]|nr:N-formylglutamate amidohydrolase [Alphaproteobacteria bacterium]